MRLAILLVLLGAQSSPAQTCEKPFEIGRLVTVRSEDLRLDRHRPISKKEIKILSKKTAQAQGTCDALVRKHPNLAVSESLSFTVEGFATIYDRCESFCGTREELEHFYEKEAEKSAPQPNQH